MIAQRKGTPQCGHGNVNATSWVVAGEAPFDARFCSFLRLLVHIKKFGAFNGYEIPAMGLGSSRLQCLITEDHS